MSEIQYRVAQFDDQGHLGPLLQSCLSTSLQAAADRSKNAHIPTTDADEELMGADDWYFQNVDLMNCVYFAWDDKTRVGAVVINVFTAELQYLVVLPDYRRQGIGKELLGEAIAELKERGVDHLSVQIPQDDSLAGATEFFSACGLLPIRTTTTFGQHLT